MANICDNALYAYSKDRKNINTIIEFFNNWAYATVEDHNESIELYFDSKWVFPEEEMCKLHEAIPNKDDIYMRCLSVEYGLDYVTYWKCNKDGWYQQI